MVRSWLRPLPDNRQTSIPPAGFEPAIPASERPQTHALDRAANGIGSFATDAVAVNSTVYCYYQQPFCIARAERDGTRAETRFRISPKRTSPFHSVGASVQSTAGSRGVRISFGGGVRVLVTHSIRQFPLHFPSRASPCATRFRTSATSQPSKGHRQRLPQLACAWQHRT